MGLENANAEGMEGGDHHPLGGFTADHVLDPFLHLLGRLVGKGDRKDLVGGNALLQQISDATGDDAGFAGTGSGQQQERPVAVDDRFALLRVETVEIEHLYLINHENNCIF